MSSLKSHMAKCFWLHWGRSQQSLANSSSVGRGLNKQPVEYRQRPKSSSFYHEDGGSMFTSVIRLQTLQR
jgi:hypothetical protein